MLSEGEITSGDISPNAGILGTQIADKTLSLRNLTDDTFGIIQKGIASLPAFTTSAVHVTTVAHGLGFAPALLVYQFSGGIYLPIPYTAFQQGGANDGKFTATFYCTVDATTLTIGGYTSAAGTYDASTYKYYLLQETAG